MPYSVALNQPTFEEGDLGFDFSSLIAPAINTLVNVGGQFVSSRISAGAIKDQIATQTQAAKDLAAFRAQKEIEVAQAQGAVPITSSPLFLPLVGGIGALFLYMAYKGKR